VGVAHFDFHSELLIRWLQFLRATRLAALNNSAMWIPPPVLAVCHPKVDDSVDRLMSTSRTNRARVLQLLLLALDCAHAKKGRPVRRPTKSSGVGFGSAARTPVVPSRAPARPPKPRSSLETKLLQEHTTNCAMAKQTFAVCADDSGACTYTAGWDLFSAPADAVSPGNEPYATSELLRRSRGPLLSETECTSLVDAMEAHGATQGWDQRYPLGGYTREVKVRTRAAACTRADRLPVVYPQPTCARSLTD
jgi:hypothetical protein